LLLTHDRVGDDEFPLTQEFLAQMLGVQRSSVNGVASTLQKDGVIRYSRGVITIVDRGALERASCECYRIIAEEFARLIPDATSSA
jgi:Mn-dependent DtxR family transcriptional regulator